MKKNIYFIILLFISIITLVSCNGKSHYTFVSSGELYSKGTQTIRVTVSEDTTTFEANVKKEDIKLSNELSGKTITTITYKDENTIEVTITGTLDNVNNNEYDYYNIELLDNALKGNSTATVVVKVFNYSPRISSTSQTYGSIGDKVLATSSFRLSYGEFIEANCTTEYITLLDENGEVSVSVIEGKLHVTVKNYVVPSDDYRYPTIKISSVCTSFNEDIYIFVGTITYSDIYK